MKIQKTDTVSANNSWRVHGLTPRFSPLPGVLDLYRCERIANLVGGKRYLIGKRQDVIVEAEGLDGPFIVLHKGVTGEAPTRSRIPIP